MRFITASHRVPLIPIRILRSVGCSSYHRRISEILIECRANTSSHSWMMAQLCVTHFPAEYEHFIELLVDMNAEIFAYSLCAHYSNMFRNAKRCTHIGFLSKQKAIRKAKNDSHSRGGRSHSLISFILHSFIYFFFATFLFLIFTNRNVNDTE